MNSYHKFLIKNRIYCEYGHGGHLERGTEVIKIDGRDTVVCSFHSYKPKKKEPYAETKPK